MKVIFSFYLLSIYSLCFGQETSVRVGYTHSWISYSKQYYDIDGKTGFFISASHGFQIKNKLTIHPEISILQRGFKGLYDTRKTKLTLYYLDISSLLKYRFGEKGRFYCLAGPYFGTGLYGNGVIEYAGSFEVKWHRFRSQDEDNHFIGYIGNRFDLGGSCGLGIKLTSNLSMDLRYNHGFTKLYTQKSSADNNGDMDAARDAKNRMLQFGLVWAFNPTKGD